MRILLTVSVLLICISSVRAQQWGDLTGKFVYDGPAPKPKAIDVQKDVEVFGKLGLVDEALVIGEGGALANVVVYCRTPNVAINPSLESNVPPKVVYDNKGGKFVPHVLTLWLTKQEVVLHNSDPVGHNSNVAPIGDEGINPLLVANSSTNHKFNKPQNIPVGVGCNIHPWMKGYILPRSNPYATVTKEDGTFTIEKLPVGDLEFVAWQEKSGFVGPLEEKDDAGNPTGKLYISVSGNKVYVKNETLKIEKDGKATNTDWLQGRFKVSIKPGKNDLGTIRVSPKLFEK